MPRRYTTRYGTARSNMVRMRRAGTQTFWVPLQPTATMLSVTHAAPAKFAFGLDTLMGNLYKSTVQGATLERVIGCLTIDMPATAYAATMIDTLVLALHLDNANLTTAQLDPTQAVGQRSRPLHEWWWHQPFNTAPTQAFQMRLISREVNLRCSKRFRNNDDDLLFVGATLFPTATTSQFNVNFTGKALIRTR